MINSPFKSSKDITSDSSTARTPIFSAAGTASNIRQEHSQGDESGEPEDHSDSFGGENSEFMSSGRIASRSKNQIDES